MQRGNYIQLYFMAFFSFVFICKQTLSKMHKTQNWDDLLDKVSILRPTFLYPRHHATKHAKTTRTSKCKDGCITFHCIIYATNTTPTPHGLRKIPKLKKTHDTQTCQQQRRHKLPSQSCFIRFGNAEKIQTKSF